VLVVGAGILGASAAYSLARRGVDVVVVDRGESGREASGANAGTLHIQMYGGYFSRWFDRDGGPSSDDRAYLKDVTRLFADAAAGWSRLEAELEADCGLRLVGGLMVAETDRQLRVLERKSEAETAMGVTTEVLSSEDVQRLEPAISPNIVGATYCRTEGFANPMLATAAFLRAAIRHGARVRLHAGVQSIEREPRGGFTVTAGSWRIRASRIIVAAGAWSNEVLGLVGGHLPMLEAHPLQVIVSEPWRPILSRLVWHAARRLTLRQTQYSTFVIGGGWPGVPASSTIKPSMRGIAGNLCVAVDVIPEITKVNLLRAWGGMTTSTGRANRVGIAGRYGSEPGLYVLVASGVGVTLSPVLGPMMAEIVLGGESSYPSDWFSLEYSSRIA
jgi:glycine/D-amino acid oxidase-like deaminating enzyme